MTLSKHSTHLAIAALLSLVTFGALAEAAEVDYVGYAWETGGLAPSQPGDEFSLASVVTQIDPLFEVDLGAVEATLFISGLVSTGESTNPSTGMTSISYTGGSLALYADASGNHDWGTNPANATVPSTFTDGSLVFAGDFTSFTLIVQPSGNGVFEGYLDGTGGSALAGPCSGCTYTFAGTFAAPTGAQIPAGYDLQIDGLLAVESTVAVENMNWGSIKSLYNPGR